MAAKKKKSTPQKTAAKKIPAKKASAKNASSKQQASKSPAKVASKNSGKVKAAAPADKSPSQKLHNLNSFLSPLDDRIVVQPVEAETTTAGGLIIPGMVADRPSRGTVLAKGPGRRNKKGQLRPLDVQVGDQVLYAEYSGSKINFANAQMLILREEDVLGIVE